MESGQADVSVLICFFMCPHDPQLPLSGKPVCAYRQAVAQWPRAGCRQEAVGMIPDKMGSSVKCVDWRIKAYALAGYDCPKPDGLKKEDELKDKMQERQIDTMPDHQPVFPSSTDNLIPMSSVFVNCFHATQTDTCLSGF